MNYFIHTSEDYNFVAGELCPPEWDGYEDAWYLEIAHNFELYTGKMFNDLHHRYLITDADYAFVEKEYADEYIKTNGSENLFVIDYEENDTEEDIHTCTCVTDDRKGFTFCLNIDDSCTKFKYYGDKVLSDDEIWEIINKEFN